MFTNRNVFIYLLVFLTSKYIRAPRICDLQANPNRDNLPFYKCTIVAPDGKLGRLQRILSSKLDPMALEKVKEFYDQEIYFSLGGRPISFSQSMDFYLNTIDELELMDLQNMFLLLMIELMKQDGQPLLQANLMRPNEPLLKGYKENNSRFKRFLTSLCCNRPITGLRIYAFDDELNEYVAITSNQMAGLYSKFRFELYVCMGVETGHYPISRMNINELYANLSDVLSEHLYAKCKVIDGQIKPILGNKDISINLYLPDMNSPDMNSPDMKIKEQCKEQYKYKKIKEQCKYKIYALLRSRNRRICGFDYQSDPIFTTDPKRIVLSIMTRDNQDRVVSELPIALQLSAFQYNKSQLLVRAKAVRNLTDTAVADFMYLIPVQSKNSIQEQLNQELTNLTTRVSNPKRKRYKGQLTKCTDPKDFIGTGDSGSRDLYAFGIDLIHTFIEERFRSNRRLQLQFEDLDTPKGDPLRIYSTQININKETQLPKYVIERATKEQLEFLCRGFAAQLHIRVYPLEQNQHMLAFSLRINTPEQEGLFMAISNIARTTNPKGVPLESVVQILSALSDKIATGMKSTGVPYSFRIREQANSSLLDETSEAGNGSLNKVHSRLDDSLSDVE